MEFTVCGTGGKAVDCWVHGIKITLEKKSLGQERNGGWEGDNIHCPLPLPSLVWRIREIFWEQRGFSLGQCFTNFDLCK